MSSFPLWVKLRANQNQGTLVSNSFFFEPCDNATGPGTGTCQHPTLRKHTDEHRSTNMEQNFKSPSTTSQPPPGMGLIYIEKKGDRVEEDINHKIIINRKWGWWLGKIEIRIWYRWERKLFLRFCDKSSPSLDTI